MDIRQLHYFLVLCDEMNYSRAAQRLFLSRQALRQSISALEAELCGPLFVSAHHKLSLTERGLSLQRHAAPVVEQFQQMQAAAPPPAPRPTPRAFEVAAALRQLFLKLIAQGKRIRHSARKADYNLSAIKTANLVGMRLENNALPHCHLTIARNRGVAIFAHGANRRASEFHAHCFPPERGFFPAPMHIIPQTAPIVTRFCLKPAFP